MQTLIKALLFIWIPQSVLAATNDWPESHFQCRSSLESSAIDAFIEGEITNWRGQEFLSYDITIREHCEPGELCLDPIASSDTMLPARESYQPTKYIDHQQFLLTFSPDGSRETTGSFQLILPKTRSPVFSAKLLMPMPWLGQGLTQDLDCHLGLSGQMPPQSVKNLLAKFSLKPHIWKASLDDILTYESLGSLSLTTALAEALWILGTDENHPESPLQIARLAVEEDWGLETQTPLDSFIRPKLYLAELMRNSHEAELALWDPSLPAEDGERASDHLDIFPATAFAFRSFVLDYRTPIRRKGVRLWIQLITHS
ncbi:MAG: hypothetical protein HRU19_26535 [Pseudobacteriovorax sp.]|nr:hypothetical protein [Pseudobacteriovorax sp.]